MSVIAVSDELVIVRRRRRYLRLAGEYDEPDLQVVGCLVEERAQSLLRRAEPRRLDVLGLHGARRVDDEDHRRLLLQQRALDVRAREADERARRARATRIAAGTNRGHERPETTVASTSRFV